jgi:S1/P1 Nuclease
MSSKLKESSDSRARAVALSWIIHLVGDLHQPLHCASRFNADFPDGDQGGNLFVIQPSDSVRQIKLHAFWDAALGTSNSVSTISHDAKVIMDDDTLQAGSLTELSTHKLLEEWANESFKLAVEIAYEDGTIPGLPQHRLDEDPNAPIPTLSPKSRVRAMDVSDRRAALAAFRLAEEIKKAIN